ncbi:uncharacterized protein [Linepithema humile]|uniref:uncharacterized protein n=1 Tax=Linepithema humile TaxID=83485 RepID=UPI00351DAFAC
MEKESSRILGRRYYLTKTGYKYLDIGINVSTPSRVEIALGDNHGKELRLSYGVWKELMNQRGIIASFFKNDVDEAPNAPDCINHLLNNVTGMVDVKFAHFSEIASGVKDPIAAIRDGKSFDKNDIIDCELLAQIFRVQ